jgi:tetratricopeptide (TPR) repeat protein
MQAGLAQALVQSGRPSEALPYLRSALSKSTHDPLIYLLLGEVYLQDGNVDDAIEQFLLCLRLQPSQVWALHGLGRAYLAKGQTQQAITAWEEALKVAPDFDLARQGLRSLQDSDRSN